MNTDNKLFDLQHAVVSFRIGGVLERTKLIAVNDVSFSLSSEKPEIFTLAGESGSGKNDTRASSARRSRGNFRKGLLRRSRHFGNPQTG